MTFTRPETAARVPWDSPTVRIVLASTLLAPLGVPLVAPALPVIRDAFAVSDAQASLVVSAYFLVGILLSPFIGMVADRVGRRRVLVVSLLGFGLAGVAIAFAPDFATVVAIRVLQGTAAAGIFVATVTVIGDAFEGVQRNAVLGVNVAVLSTGAAVFPIVGGALVAVSWNAPFLLYVAALPLGLVALRYLDEPDHGDTERGFAYLRGAARAIASREAGVYYGAAFLCELLLFGAIVTALPFVLTGDYGLSPLVVGLVVAATEAGSVVVSTQNGRLARHVSNPGLVAAGFACFGLALLVLWAAPSAWVLALGAVVFGAGLGLSMPSVDAGVSALVPAEFRAGALSLRNSTTFLGRATGPVLFAGVATVTGYDPLLVGGAAVALVAALLAAVVTGRRLRPQRVVEKPA